MDVPLLSDEEIEDLLGSGQSDNAREAAKVRLERDPDDAAAHYYLGVLQLAKKNGKKALPDLLAALEKQPEEPRFLIAVALAHDFTGNGQEAINLLLKALSIAPDDLSAQLNLGRVAVANSFHEQAVVPLARVLESEPKLPEAHHWLAIALRALGRVPEAADHYLEAIRLQPGNLWLLNGLAVCHMRLGRFNDGMAQINQIIESLPRDRSMIFAFGIECLENGSPFAALQYFKRLCSWFPDDLDGCVNLGLVLQGLGKPSEALFYFQKAIAINPKHADSYSFAGVLFEQLRDKERARQLFEKALELNPNHVNALLYLASKRKEKGENDAAKKMLRRLIKANPNVLQAYLNLASFLKEWGEYKEAEKVIQQAESHHIFAEEFWHLRADLHLKQGDIAGAMAIYRAILVRQPNNPDAMSGMLFCMNYDPDTPPATLANAYKDWDKRFVAHLRPKEEKFANDPDPERRLKVGYISGDFKTHSVAFFADPILAQHDHDNFEIYCYANHEIVDPVTLRFISYADHWRWVHSLSDDAVAELIRLDEIDILVDLSNHTAYHRLYTMARKPAPIQMTWLGMPTTTGLSAIDYRITDAAMDPVGMTEHLHSEKLLRLTSGWCYVPPDEGKDVPVGELPALRNGYLTFASFNAFGKINVEVIKVWAKIFQEIPTAKLYMATGGKENNKKLNKTVLSTFKACGFPVEQLILFWHKPFAEYFAFHNEVDIVLDSFPYTGGTVTAHALWMGTPVLTLAGRKPIHRTGTSMLTSVGLTEFIAKTPLQYVNIAKRFAKNFKRLAEIRRTCRDNMLKSPLMDKALVVSDLEAGYRSVWHEWCELRQAAQKDEKDV